MSSVLLSKVHHRDVTKSVHALQKEFRRRGWHRPATTIILGQFAIVLTMMIGGLAVFAFAPSILAKIVGMIISTMGALGVSTQAHTASHGAIARDKKFNRLLTYLGYPV